MQKKSYLLNPLCNCVSNQIPHEISQCQRLCGDTNTESCNYEQFLHHLQHNHQQKMTAFVEACSQLLEISHLSNFVLKCWFRLFTHAHSTHIRSHTACNAHTQCTQHIHITHIHLLTPPTHTHVQINKKVILKKYKLYYLLIILMYLEMKKIDQHKAQVQQQLKLQ